MSAFELDSPRAITHRSLKKMRHPTAAAIAKINMLLKLDERSYGQDWEIEASDPRRLDEYFHHYRESLDNDDERYTLMSLILGGFEEYHTQTAPAPDVWNQIRSLLVEDVAIHHDLIAYYQCNDSPDEEDCFPIASLMRSINLGTKPSESGRREVLTPAPHTTGHTDP